MISGNYTLFEADSLKFLSDGNSKDNFAENNKKFQYLGKFSKPRTNFNETREVYDKFRAKKIEKLPKTIVCKGLLGGAPGFGECFNFYLIFQFTFSAGGLRGFHT